VDVASVIRQRLVELNLDQKELAAAAEVTESYVSQLLTRKKLPPAPDRTDLYYRIEKFLKIPAATLSKLATLQRKDELKRSLGDPQPTPLLREVRELILRKCLPAKERQMREIFEREPFGDVERLVTQKLLEVVKRVAKEELESEDWLHRIARLSGRSYKQMRVFVLEFLDSDVFSAENCVSFLDPLIESWDIDLATFAMEITLSRRLAPRDPYKFEFVERDSDPTLEEEAGLKEFLRDRSLSGDAAPDEIEFLRKLRFKGKRPTSLYYYRELQNLRDPLHFRKLARVHGTRES
jgi:transcriptional regulator with XRE-family HTH domain